MSFYVGAIPSSYFDGQSNTTEGSKTATENLHLAELLDEMMVKRVPSNIVTAAHTVTTQATWEDYDIITALNLVLTNNIRTGEAVLLYLTIELVNGEAAVNNLKYGHGGTPDDDNTVRSKATGGAAQSYYDHAVLLITDSSGNIKVEVDDKTNLTLKFHLEGYQYVHKAALT